MDTRPTTEKISQTLDITIARTLRPESVVSVMNHLEAKLVGISPWGLDLIRFLTHQEGSKQTRKVKVGLTSNADLGFSDYRTIKDSFKALTKESHVLCQPLTAVLFALDYQAVNPETRIYAAMLGVDLPDHPQSIFVIESHENELGQFYLRLRATNGQLERMLGNNAIWLHETG